MRYIQIHLLAMLFLASAIPAWANGFMPSGDCHNVDMYGIYTICGAPPDDRRPDNRPQTVVSPVVYATEPEPLMTTAPVVEPVTAPMPVETVDPTRRDPGPFQAKLHALHLLLADKQSRGDIAPAFFDEEARYLDQIGSDEQSAAQANGGYLTVAQEINLMQQLQDVEGEITDAAADNSPANQSPA